MRSPISGSSKPAASDAATASLDAATIRAAGEVIVVLGDRLPSYLEAWLHVRLAAGDEVTVLSGPWCAPDYLRELLERGCRVYDAVLPAAESLLFLDRRRGYRLPAGAPISQPFETASALMWQRIGAYVHFVGRVSAVYAAECTFQMVEFERVWLVVPPDAPLPEVGAKLSVLCRAFWGGGSGITQVFAVVACWPAGES
jgi:hypothetical protein